MRPTKCSAPARLLSLTFGSLVLACADPQSPTEPGAGLPTLSIADAVHNAGNRHFYLLPPLVSQPSVSGTADGTLTPSVTICQWDGGCSDVVAQFDVTSGTGSAVVGYDAGQQQYHVNWKTDQCVWGPCTLDPALSYRLVVSVQGIELGYADLQILANASQAKNLQTNEYIPLVEGRTLPIRFRIEAGIVAGVAIAPNPASVPAGQTTRLSAIVTDLHGTILATPVVTWRSAGAQIATVDASGVLSGLLSGCTSVLATSEGVSGAAEVKVTPLAADFVFRDTQRVPPNDGGSYIYAGRTDGCTIPYRITATQPQSEQVSDIAVSHDGQWIGFVGGGDGKIHTIRIDGTSERILDTPSLRPLYLSWSPDGTRMAFLAEIGSSSEVFAIDPDGTDLQQLTHVSHVLGPVRWSPSGARLAFHRFDGVVSRVTLIDPDGNNLVDLTPVARYASYPAWSPDGSLLAYQDLFDGSIWKVPASGGPSQQVAPSQNQISSSLAFSPNGTQIAYTAYTCGNSALLAVPAAGGSPLLLACAHPPQRMGDNGIGWTPAWTRDGRELLYTLFDGLYRLYSVTNDGTSTRYLGTGKTPVTLP